MVQNIPLILAEILLKIYMFFLNYYAFTDS